MKRRSASMLLEAVLALTLVAAAMVAIAQVTILAAHQRREAEWRGVATREAANLMERAMQLPWEDVTAESFERWALSPTVRQRLRDPALSITVREADGSQKEVQVSVEWKNSAGRPANPVSLSAWIYAAGGGE